MIEYEATEIDIKVEGDVVGRIHRDDDGRWAFCVTGSIDLYPEELLDLYNVLLRIEECGVTKFLKG